MMFILLALLFPFVVKPCNVPAYASWATIHRNLSQHQNERDACAMLHSNSKMAFTSKHHPRVVLFLFHRDEEDLLSDWLQYHTFMFGFDGVHVIDNNSQEDAVCKILALYELCGVKVTRFNGEFGDKYKILSSVMRNTTADFLLPLDTDEFVVSMNRHTFDVSFNPSSMAHRFANLLVDGRKYKFRELAVMYDNTTCLRRSEEPVRRVALGGILNRHRREPGMVKTFFHARGFLETDQGNHYGRVQHDAQVHADPQAGQDLSRYYIFSDVTLLHFAVPSYAAMGAKMRRGAAVYGYTDATNCSAVGPGRHYCQTAKEFRAHTRSSEHHFMTQCLSKEPGVAAAQFSDWFARNTLTMEQLVGPSEAPQRTGAEETPAQPSPTFNRGTWMEWIARLFSLFM